MIACNHQEVIKVRYNLGLILKEEDKLDEGKVIYYTTIYCNNCHQHRPRLMCTRWLSPVVNSVARICVQQQNYDEANLNYANAIKGFLLLFEHSCSHQILSRFTEQLCGFTVCNACFTRPRKSSTLKC